MLDKFVTQIPSASHHTETCLLKTSALTTGTNPACLHKILQTTGHIFKKLSEVNYLMHLQLINL